MSPPRAPNLPRLPLACHLACAALIASAAWGAAPEPGIRLAAVGDVLIHAAVKRVARNHAATHGNEGYDAIWTEVAPRISTADLAFANLEVPIAPISPVPVAGEVFDAPPAVTRSLAAAGFDVVSLANNHGYDQGISGVAETVAHVAAAGLVGVGAGTDRASARRGAIVERGGFRVGFLARADLSNLDPEPAADQPSIALSGGYCPNGCGPDRDARAYHVDADEIRASVAELRGRGAEIVVLSMHWGIEYTTTPLPMYGPVVDALTDAGVDVVLGHHPHVLQPIATRVTADGRTAVVAWSLGNFVSDMAASWAPGQPSSRLRTRDGVILEIDFVRRDGRAAVGSVRAAPTFTENTTRTAPPGILRPVLSTARRAEIAQVVGEAFVE